MRAGCWSHARRKFKEAFDTGSRQAARVLGLINRLFAIERAVKGRGERRNLPHADLLELRSSVRHRTSKRLLDRLYLEVARLGSAPSTLPKSKLGKAVTYATNQRQPLCVFLDEPGVPIHNNDQERDLRHVVTGRKNWQLFASPKGGEVACRLYSLILSCKQNGVNPEAYIEGVLQATRTTKASDIASLTPWAWAARDEEPAN